MADKETFREEVQSYLGRPQVVDKRTGRRLVPTQARLASECGVEPETLNRKLKDPQGLSEKDLRIIGSTLIFWGRITHRKQLQYLFEYVGYRLTTEDWEEEPWKWLTDDLGEEISSPHPKLEEQYRAYLHRMYGDLRLWGIASRLQGKEVKIPLEALFVHRRAEEGGDLWTPMKRSSRRGFEVARMGDLQLVGLDEMQTAPRAVILGEPGVGKSTLLQWMLLQNIENDTMEKKKDVSQRALPVFIRLVDFAAMVAHHPRMSLEEYLLEQHELTYRALFKAALEHGRLWILLDGLDEVADSQRKRVQETIDKFALLFPHVERILVASRTVGYRNVQLDEMFRRFTLQRFERPEIQTFAYNWYRVILQKSHGISDEAHVTKRAEDLLGQLDEKPRILQLAGTPLLLTIIALMHWKGKSIPQRRLELYEAATTTLLEDWPQARQRPKQEMLSLIEMIQILAEVAFDAFQRNSSTVIPAETMEQRIIQLIQEVHQCSPSQARTIKERWVPFLSEHSGLLQEIGKDKYSRHIYLFLHLTFVEYLSGRALTQRWEQGTLELQAYANEPRWREVILLMAGHIGMDSAAKATLLIKEVYQLKPPYDELLHQSLTLVASCLADDVDIENDLRKGLLKDIVSFWHQSTSSRLKSKLFRTLGDMRGTNSAREVVKLVLPLLNDGSTQLRSSVLELLGELGIPSDQKLKAQLLSALNAPEASLQRAAVHALDRLGLTGFPDIQEELMRALQKGEPRVRCRVIAALAGPLHQQESFVDLLLQILKQDQSSDVRTAAAHSLGTLSSPSEKVIAGLLSTIYDDKGVHKEAIANMLRWDEQSRHQFMQGLEQKLHAPDAKSKEKALEMVGSIGAFLPQQASALLLEMAQDDKHQAFLPQIIAKLGLIPTGNDRLTQFLTSMLKVQVDDRRLMATVPGEAAKALGRLKIRHPQVSRDLTDLLTHENSSIKRLAAEALTTCAVAEPATVRALSEALASMDEQLKLCAAQALLEISSDVRARAKETIIELLGSKNSEIRRLAVKALQGHISLLIPEDSMILVTMARNDSYRTVPEEVLKLLAELGEEAGKEVVEVCLHALLHHDYPPVRRQAAETLGKIGVATDTVINDLIQALDDNDKQHVSLAASQALVLLGEGPDRDKIIHRVQAHLAQRPDSGEALNTLWGLIVGEQ